MVAVIHLDRRKKARTILRIGQRLPNKPEKIDRRFFGRAVEVYFRRWSQFGVVTVEYCGPEETIPPPCRREVR